MALHYVDAKVSAFYYKNPSRFLRHRSIKCRFLEAILGLKSMSLVRLDPQGFGFLWFVTGTVELTLEMVIYLLAGVTYSTYTEAVLNAVPEVMGNYKESELLVLTRSSFYYSF